MKKIILSASIIVMLFCSSCGLFGNQEYNCDIEEVESIQIVSLDKYIEGEYRYEYTIISRITDKEVFVTRLNGLQHAVNWGEPQQMEEGYIVIKIDYLNGDFDLIHSSAQYFNRSGENQYGYFFFDDEQFNELISEYQ